MSLCVHVNGSSSECAEHGNCNCVSSLLWKMEQDAAKNMHDPNKCLVTGCSDSVWKNGFCQGHATSLDGAIPTPTSMNVPQSHHQNHQHHHSAADQKQLSKRHSLDKGNDDVHQDGGVLYWKPSNFEQFKNEVFKIPGNINDLLQPYGKDSSMMSMLAGAQHMDASKGEHSNAPPTSSKCSHASCSNEVVWKGACAIHYLPEISQDMSSPIPSNSNTPNESSAMLGICSNESCTMVAKHRTGLGVFCANHVVRPCQFPNCQKHAVREGVCASHVSQLEMIRGSNGAPDGTKARARTESKADKSAAAKRKSRMCIYPGCSKFSQRKGLCRRHEIETGGREGRGQNSKKNKEKSRNSRTSGATLAKKKQKTAATSTIKQMVADSRVSAPSAGGSAAPSSTNVPGTSQQQHKIYRKCCYPECIKHPQKNRLCRSHQNELEEQFAKSPALLTGRKTMKELLKEQVEMYKRCKHRSGCTRPSVFKQLCKEHAPANYHQMLASSLKTGATNSPRTLSKPPRGASNPKRKAQTPTASSKRPKQKHPKPSTSSRSTRPSAAVPNANLSSWGGGGGTAARKTCTFDKCKRASVNHGFCSTHENASLCQFSSCSTLLFLPGLCNRHLKCKYCSFPSCKNQVIHKTNACTLHSHQPRCYFHQCYKFALPNHTFCNFHKSARSCQYYGCEEFVVDGMTCDEHKVGTVRGGEQCSFDNCYQLGVQEWDGRCLYHRKVSLCQFGTCEDIIQHSPGLCMKHSMDRRCAYPGCAEFGLADGPCIMHQSAPRCHFSQCYKFSMANSFYCQFHAVPTAPPAASALASYSSSCSSPTDRNFSFTNNSHEPARSSLCIFPSCTNEAKKRGLCNTHLEASFCQVSTCQNYVLSPGFCAEHNKNPICAFFDCYTPTKHESGSCMKHRRELRCMYYPCYRFSSKNSKFCYSHQSARVCAEDNCREFILRIGEVFCLDHGGAPCPIFSELPVDPKVKPLVSSDGTTPKGPKRVDRNHSKKDTGTGKSNKQKTRQKKDPSLCRIPRCMTKSIPNSMFCTAHLNAKASSSSSSSSSPSPFSGTPKSNTSQPPSSTTRTHKVSPPSSRGSNHPSSTVSFNGRDSYTPTPSISGSLGAPSPAPTFATEMGQFSSAFQFNAFPGISLPPSSYTMQMNNTPSMMFSTNHEQALMGMGNAPANSSSHSDGNSTRHLSFTNSITSMGHKNPMPSSSAPTSSSTSSIDTHNTNNGVPSTMEISNGAPPPPSTSSSKSSE